MKVLELFAGTRSIGKAFEKRGHEVFSVDWNEDFENIDLYADISTLTADDILSAFGKPDVIWASPDCTSYSIAAISHHRKREASGNLAPVSEYAKFCDKANKHLLELIKQLGPKYFFIENPRRGLRKMDFMRCLPRYTVTYCQYGDKRQKPTDIFTN
ncbi:MAG: DNA cytosine methyltransferase, partial [Elusimicrobiaceae bacterium]|nr:DNA cytosine methyltransferase [Elusimicrobiaceae bacterium]